MVLVLGVVYRLLQTYRSEQVLLRHRLEALAEHAAQGADALRVLAQDSTNPSERYRALFHLRSLEQEVRLLERWSGHAFPPNELFPVAALASGNFETLPLAELSEKLFEVEGMFRRLAVSEGRIGRGEVRQVLDDAAALLFPRQSASAPAR